MKYRSKSFNKLDIVVLDKTLKVLKNEYLRYSRVIIICYNLRLKKVSILSVSLSRIKNLSRDVINNLTHKLDFINWKLSKENRGVEINYRQSHKKIDRNYRDV